jgi:hypothetical protein
MTAAGLREFKQNSAGAGRVYKSDEQAARAEAWRFINQANAARFEIVELGVDVRDF